MNNNSAIGYIYRLRKLPVVRRTPFFLLLLLLTTSVFAQTTREQSWFAASFQERVSRRSGIWLDGYMKLDGSFYKRSWSSLIRTAYIWYASDNLRFMGGYAHIVNYGTTNIPEERIWEQIQYARKGKRLRLSQYVRLEERFKKIVNEGVLLDEYDYKTTLRYNIQVTSKPFGSSGNGIFVYTSNELFLNMSSKISRDLFDQDRVSAGLGYRFSQQISVQAGYLYSHQQLTNNRGNVNINVLRLSFYHTMDFRKKA